MARILQANAFITGIFAVLFLSASFCPATPPPAKKPTAQPQLLPMPASVVEPVDPRKQFFDSTSKARGSPFSRYAPNPYLGSNPYSVPLNPNASAVYAKPASAARSSAIGYSNPYMPASRGPSAPVVGPSMPPVGIIALNAAPPGVMPQLLDTLGLPTEKGQLRWPLGLRILAPALEAESLRQQVNGLMQALALEVATGHVQATTLELAARGTADLRYLLRKGYGASALAETTQRDAKRFLDRLDRAIRSAAAVRVSAGTQR